MPYNYEGASAGTATFASGGPSAVTQITYAGGESCIVTVSAWGFGSIVGPTVVDDSGVNDYTYIGTWGEHQSLFYLHQAAAGTFQLGFGRTSGFIGSLRAYKFSGLANAAPIASAGQLVTGTGSSGPDNILVGSPNVSVVPALVFAVTRKQNDANPPIAGSGWTLCAERLLHEPTPGAANGAAQHRRVTSAGVLNSFFSSPVAGNDEFEDYQNAVVAFAELVVNPWAFTGTGPRTDGSMAGGPMVSGALGSATRGTFVPSAGLAKVWDGSAWAAKPVKYWTGSAWVQKPAKHWNGSAWQ